MVDSNMGNPRPIPMRRYFFAVVVVSVMVVAAYLAVRVGVEIIGIEDCRDASLGTIALVVSPMVSVVGALSAILANMLRQE